MMKLVLMAAAVLVALTPQALAEKRLWNITEENAAGIKDAQGQWQLNVDGSKLSGDANLQYDNGNTLTYSVEGVVNGSEYTVNMNKRTDGKTGCVWSGHAPTGQGEQKHGLVGKVVCDGNVKFGVRAAF